jgi:uncharacterized membrane protein
MISTLKRAKKLLVAGLALLSLAVSLQVFYPVPAFADLSTDAAKSSACTGIGATSSNGTCTSSGPSLDNLIAQIVNVFSILVSIVAVIMIMVGGFKYITSGGDSSKVGSAKSTIVYAVIGLVIVALAQVIVKFVIKTATDKPPVKKAAIVLVQRV